MGFLWLETKRNGTPDCRNTENKGKERAKHKTSTLGELVCVDHPCAMGLAGDNLGLEPNQ